MTYFEKVSANAEDVQRLSAIAIGTADQIIEYINEGMMERVVDEILCDKTGTTAHFIICRLVLHIREIRKQIEALGYRWERDEGRAQ